MYYKKLIVGDSIIEFHNDWLGTEMVIANGHQVSKGSSVWGMNHYFNIIEEGKNVRYVLTTKVNMNLQILLDLTRNGRLVHENVLPSCGFKPKKPQNRQKKQGLEKLKNYELVAALELFRMATKEAPRDAEIYFHMACAYSVLENVPEGYQCIKKAVEYGLPNPEKILSHGMLAFLRLQDPFEAFVESEFTSYEIAESKYALMEEVLL